MSSSAAGCGACGQLVPPDACRRPRGVRPRSWHAVPARRRSASPAHHGSPQASLRRPHACLRRFTRPWCPVCVPRPRRAYRRATASDGGGAPVAADDLRMEVEHFLEDQVLQLLLWKRRDPRDGQPLGLERRGLRRAKGPSCDHSASGCQGGWSGKLGGVARQRAGTGVGSRATHFALAVDMAEVVGVLGQVGVGEGLSG